MAYCALDVQADARGSERNERYSQYPPQNLQSALTIRIQSNIGLHSFPTSQIPAGQIPLNRAPRSFRDTPIANRWAARTCRLVQRLNDGDRETARKILFERPDVRVRRAFAEQLGTPRQIRITG